MTEPKIQLRQWADSDLKPLQAMNADTEVMQFFLKTLNHDESQRALDRFRDSIEKRGWGLWAVEVDGVFAGFTGLSAPTFTTHFSPCIEIGWRFLPEFWGKSIAYSAAKMAEDHAFNILKLEELVSFTTESNIRSRRLMERLEFTRDPEEDFNHPVVPDGHPLLRHVLYRKKNPNKQPH